MTYKPTRNILQKHGILKGLHSNKGTVITRSNKGSGVVILDKIFYEEKILKLISDVNKFKKLNEDPTLIRGEQLQRFLKMVKCFRIIFSLKKQTIQFSFSFNLYFQQKKPQSC